MSINPGKCRVKNCSNPPLNLFCDAHIRNPVTEELKFSDDIKVTPSIFKKTKNLDSDFQLANALVNAIMLTSPLNIQTSRPIAYKTIGKIKSSVDHNNSVESMPILQLAIFHNNKSKYEIILFGLDFLDCL